KAFARFLPSSYLEGSAGAALEAKNFSYMHAWADFTPKWHRQIASVAARKGDATPSSMLSATKKAVRACSS
ncbi:hypothetical protein ACCS93_38435, partial [Rhizobium ruizarguesonis]